MSDHPDDRELLTLEEVGERIGLKSRRTIRAFLRRHAIEELPIDSNGRVRVRRADLRRIEAGRG